MVWTISWEVGHFGGTFSVGFFVAENFGKEFPNELILMNCIWVILTSYSRHLYLFKALLIEIITISGFDDLVKDMVYNINK